jgi:hypothetical protein
MFGLECLAASEKDKELKEGATLLMDRWLRFLSIWLVLRFVSCRMGCDHAYWITPSHSTTLICVNDIEDLNSNLSSVLRTLISLFHNIDEYGDLLATPIRL